MKSLSKGPHARNVYMKFRALFNFSGVSTAVFGITDLILAFSPRSGLSITYEGDRNEKN